MNNTRVFKMSFASVYPHYVQKAEKKGRTETEVKEIIFWLTGYDEKALKEMIPVNRFGTAEEVAKLVSFLASDNSAYITGEVISINGGLYT